MATVTVFAVPTFLLSYVAVSDARATFAESLASPAGTLTRVSRDVSVIEAAVVRL